MKNDNQRVNVADALRGFAIFGILMMHSYEQMNLFNHPAAENELLRFTDAILGNAVPFLFAGKAYAMFALLFGFSFFIQNDGQLKKGYDFRPRFVWRLALLFLWGVLNSVFYAGDVLISYSLLGLTLVLTARLSDKAVLIIAVILLIMPMQWATIVYALFNPDYSQEGNLYHGYFMKVLPVLKEGNLLDMIKETYNSQMFSLMWWIDSGRIFQTVALFLFGMLIGRKRLFINTPENITFWRRSLVAGIICYLPLAGLMPIVKDFAANEVIRRQLGVLLSSYSSFAFFVFLSSLIVLTYYKSRFGKVLAKLEPIGRMSLTMYLSQSVIGGFVFYSWGLGASGKLPVTFSVLVGVGILVLQYTFARYWLKGHRHGPLEYVWKKATWIGTKR